jgi:hypothetical protein
MVLSAPTRTKRLFSHVAEPCPVCRTKAAVGRIPANWHWDQARHLIASHGWRVVTVDDDSIVVRGGQPA